MRRRGLFELEDACGTPFGAQPACFAGAGLRFTPTTAPCVEALAAAYNVTAEPLTAGAAIIDRLRGQCGMDETEVRVWRVLILFFDPFGHLVLPNCSCCCAGGLQRRPRAQGDRPAAAGGRL